jgi:hypothetical protein
MGDPLRSRFLAHDLLFAANTDTDDPRKWAPSYKVWDPELQIMRVTEIDREAAARALATLIIAGRREGSFDRRRGEQALRALMDSLVEGPGVRLYWAHWDNRDDTNFDGAIAVNVSTGEVRVLMTNDFA